MCLCIMDTRPSSQQAMCTSCCQPAARAQSNTPPSCGSRTALFQQIFSLFRIFFVFPFSSIDLISTNFALRHVIYLLLSLLQHWGCAVQPHQLLNQVPNPGRSDRSPRRQVPVSEPAGAAGCGRSGSTSPRQAGFCSSPTSSAWCPRPPSLP